MQGLTEIRWHGRGGQGAVTAAKMVAEVALGQQKYFQAFPEYGPERSGAPIVAFTRISDEPIQIYSGIEHPQIVVVLDATLLSIVDVTSGAPDDAVVLVNTELSPAELRAKTGLKGTPALHHRGDAHRHRDDPPRHPQHADGRRAHARRPACSPSKAWSSSCAPISARSSRPRWSKATSRPLRAPTRRSRANDGREESGRQAARSPQEARRQEAPQAQVGHLRHRFWGVGRHELGATIPEAGNSIYNETGGWRSLLPDDRRREVRRLHALLLLLPRRLDHRRRTARRSASTSPTARAAASAPTSAPRAPS